jgi:CHAT domain-containing protein/tetratricopeptide (TPR) repeat protein
VYKAKYLIVVMALALACLACPAQQISSASIWKNLVSLDTNQVLPAADKLKRLYEWKKESDALRLPRDSVYARLLHKIGAYEFYASRNYYTALVLTMQALRINTSGKPGSCTRRAVTDLYNIAFYYDNLNLLKKALPYYDSAILLAVRNKPDPDKMIAKSRIGKAYVYFRLGDYEKAVEESDRARIDALETGDSLSYLSALNQRAQSLFFQGKLRLALEDARTAINLGGSLHEAYQLASALKTQAFILAAQRDFSDAQVSYTRCIAERVKSKQFGQIAGDYNDLANFYRDTLKSFQKAESCYLLAVQYARKDGDSIPMARALINMVKNYYNLTEFDKAISCYQEAMRCMNIGQGGDFSGNPVLADLKPFANKELILRLFDCKMELLLKYYCRSSDKKWLNVCLRTALLNDSLLGEMRHEQLGEQSKLFWRDNTRNFFAHALEACYLAGDDNLAFYFMEKSRSVLLQDRLNELGASAYLPPQEAARQEKLQIDMIEFQQRLGSLPDTSVARVAAQKDLLASKERLEQYDQSLERSYPAYYQYKYADQVSSLAALQEHLAKNNQRFLDYFVGDTLCYALCIQPHGTSFIRATGKGRDYEEQFARFVRFCSDENALNRDFPGFLRSANDLYELLFRPFDLKGGRVIVCQDSYLVPFEALSANPLKADFLINDYSFSYVYSARYLLHPYASVPGKGDFLGIAPVHFAAFAGLPDLQGSEDALRNCSASFGRRKLLLGSEASRRNFIEQVAHYNTSTILTHARADSSDDEPLLFMNDSVIHLSELQLLDKPAAKLIILSACQTNVGRNRSGEGVFSLARGFSAAGIPAVAATQWAADEAAIYSISQKFNEFIFDGMNKDEALQKAKLFYMLQDRKGNQLPCYWANMILIGNTDPVRFSTGWGLGWYVLALVLVLGCGIFWIYRFRRREGAGRPAR